MQVGVGGLQSIITFKEVEGYFEKGKFVIETLKTLQLVHTLCNILFR